MWNGTSPTNLFRFEKIRLITLSCDVKISAVYSFVCHKARVRRTDGQTDERTDRITIPKTALALLLRAVKNEDYTPV